MFYQTRLWCHDFYKWPTLWFAQSSAVVLFMLLKRFDCRSLYEHSFSQGTHAIILSIFVLNYTRSVSLIVYFQIADVRIFGLKWWNWFWCCSITFCWAPNGSPSKAPRTSLWETTDVPMTPPYQCCPVTVAQLRFKIQYFIAISTSW